ncbi:MAG: HAMP domain-containing sensor histidine kinase [Candidatus Omnitrophota bacterium]
MVRDKAPANKELNLVLQELKENPFEKFHLAFCLMSLIPFLVFFYLLAARLFSFDILLGDIGLVLFLTIFISVCGFFIGYGIIRNVMLRIVFYAAKAKQSDQLKSIFVANVSHELKSPLTIMKINLSNFLDGLIGKITQEQEKAIKLCDGIIERMKRMINDLLDLHKLEAGMVGFNRKQFKLDDLLQRETNEFQPMVNKKRIKLTKDIAVNNLSIWADEDKIMQVVNNLLSNAVKYTPEKGQVQLKAYAVDGYVRVEVLDTAEGIPDNKLKKIFDKFERINLTQEGTGLGLAITKDIVELHKGSIWAERQPDQGNKFVVILPRDFRTTPR